MMKSWQVCIILFSVIAIYNSPKYYESWNKHDTEKLEIQRKADNDKYEALLKIANSPVFQKYVTKEYFQIAMATFKGRYQPFGVKENE